jgi:hypothetical protein
MIFTEYHIKLYKQVGGDVDHLQRIGTLEEKSLENQKFNKPIIFISQF